MSNVLRVLLQSSGRWSVRIVLFGILLVAVAGCGTEQPAIPTEVSFSAESDEITDEVDEETQEPAAVTADPNEETPEPDDGTPEPDDSTPEPDDSTPEPDDGASGAVVVPSQSTAGDTFTITATQLTELDEENQYLLDVSLRNGSGADVEVSADDLTIIDVGGTVYMPVEMPENINPPAVNITLTDDENLRGFAQYELPPGAQPSHVQWCLDDGCETVIGSVILNVPPGMEANE